MCKDVHIPLQPSCATMGLATAEDEPQVVVPPGASAGNVDTKHLTAGVKLHLPVLVPGALFSAVDRHAARGDAEVCVTGIKCSMWFSLCIKEIKGCALRPGCLQFVKPPGSLRPFSDARGDLVNATVGGDLIANAQSALRGPIDSRAPEEHQSPEVAHIVCSLATDPNISQMVDASNYGVAACLALRVFTAITRRPSHFRSKGSDKGKAGPKKSRGSRLS